VTDLCSACSKRLHQPLVPVSNDVPDTEEGCTTPAEKVIDPVTPPLDVGSATLIGDGSECLTTDCVARRVRDSPDVAGLWMVRTGV
jgi:hypothetical protein